MISKHVPMRSQASSSFTGLVEYITDEQSKEHRLGAISITNSKGETLEDALIEVESTQALNTRATGDKTFHMLISFRTGENPSQEVLQKVEDRMCAALGYSSHQRVSAVHRDTDNLHIHIAINKINPLTGTYHEPFQFHRTMGEMCDKLEREFGLEADNHISNKRGAESRAIDMERHAGIDSLITWVRRECLESMREATTWAELHQVLQNHGLTMKLRGNGCVLETGDGVMVKPSTIDRDLSKPSLESRLGAFVAAEGQGRATPAKKYEKPPRPMRVNTVELYAKYRDAQATLTRTRNAQLQLAREQRDEAIKKARQSAKVRRGLSKLASDARTVRRTADRGIGKTLAKQDADQLKKSLQAIQAEYQRTKASLYTGKQRETWADWLRSQALQGNAEALTALRSREAATGLKGATLSGTAQPKGAAAPATVDGITKKGTIIYRAGASAIRDDGERLAVSRQADQATIVEALKLAAQQLGPVLTVQGSAEFKAKAIRAAVDAGLAIRFSDPALELRRISLTQQERTHDTTARPSQPDAARLDGGRSLRHGAGVIQQRGATHFNSAGRGGTANGGAERGNAPSKPNIGRVGRNPPPQSQNRLRSLSQLGVVRIASGTQVLLPSDVSRNLDQQGAQPAHPLRRPVFGSRLTNASLAAADKYIAEREAKRAQGFDISKHIPYNHGSGELSFAGVRSVEGHTLVLLKRTDDALLVAPVDEALARRLSRLKIGDPVAVTERGGLKTTGRKNTQ